MHSKLDRTVIAEGTGTTPPSLGYTTLTQGYLFGIHAATYSVKSLLRTTTDQPHELELLANHDDCQHQLTKIHKLQIHNPRWRLNYEIFRNIQTNMEPHTIKINSYDPDSDTFAELHNRSHSHLDRLLVANRKLPPLKKRNQALKESSDSYATRNRSIHDTQLL